MPHALIIGGTGPLRGVALALAQRGWATSVTGQIPQRLDHLAADAASRGAAIHPIPVDEAREHDFAAALDAAILARGPVTLTVCWVHDDAARKLPIIARRLDDPPSPGRVFQLIATDTTDQRATTAARDIELRFPDIAWRRILLGGRHRARETGEIQESRVVTAVLDAIDHDWTESVVGLVRPAAHRPE